MPALEVPWVGGRPWSVAQGAGRGFGTRAAVGGGGLEDPLAFLPCSASLTPCPPSRRPSRSGESSGRRSSGRRCGGGHNPPRPRGRGRTSRPAARASSPWNTGRRGAAAASSAQGEGPPRHAAESGQDWRAPQGHPTRCPPLWARLARETALICSTGAAPPTPDGAQSSSASWPDRGPPSLPSKWAQGTPPSQD